MSKGLIVKRDITKEECPWLDNTIKRGRIVYPYSGCTYGCISDDGCPVTEYPGKTPFFEVPRDSVEAA